MDRADGADGADGAEASIALVQVAHDEPRLDRLLQLYMHEWSALVPTAIGADARYVYDELPLYRDRDGRGAYLFLDGGGAPVGCALTVRDATGQWHVEEFFIVAGARRRQLGATAARRLFAARPGAWTFTVRPENPGALGFWRAVVPGATEQVEVGADGIARRRLSFVIPAAAPGAAGR